MIAVLCHVHDFVPGDQLVEHLAVGMTDNRVRRRHQRGRIGCGRQNHRTFAGLVRTDDGFDGTGLDDFDAAFYDKQVVIAVPAPDLKNLPFAHFDKAHDIGDFRDAFRRQQIEGHVISSQILDNLIQLDAFHSETSREGIQLRKM